MLSRLPGGAPGNTLTRSFNQQSPVVKIDWFIDSKNAFSSTYNYMRAHNVNGIQTSLFYNGTGSNGSDDVRIHSYNVRLTTSISP
ncbi:MAG: hypothetical protein JWO80_881 [Bryobacterales bacterium]|nr:hypothetical protein [Bryobacterales bacterium]